MGNFDSLTDITNGVFQCSIQSALCFICWMKYRMRGPTVKPTDVTASTEMTYGLLRAQN